MKVARELHMRAPAKVNLFLRVLGRRPDGYHDIETVFHGITLADDLTVAATLSGSVTVEMSHPQGLPAGVPTPEDNLAFVAARALAARSGMDVGAEIRITKRIPLGAGLGGGSSDAAGALVALNTLWGTGLDMAGLIDVARDVGSDVPYFLVGGSATGTGRGEVVRPIAAGAGLWFVLGISTFPLNTADVYERWSTNPSTGPPGLPNMIEAVRAGDPALVGARVHNDLEPAACGLRPELGDATTAMAAAGALGARVSGSGPTVFGVAASRAHAEEVAARVAPSFDVVEIVSSAPRGGEHA